MAWLPVRPPTTDVSREPDRLWPRRRFDRRPISQTTSTGSCVAAAGLSPCAGSPTLKYSVAVRGRERDRLRDRLPDREEAAGPVAVLAPPVLNRLPAVDVRGAMRLRLRLRLVAGWPITGSTRLMGYSEAPLVEEGASRRPVLPAGPAEGTREGWLLDGPWLRWSPLLALGWRSAVRGQPALLGFLMEAASTMDRGRYEMVDGAVGWDAAEPTYCEPSVRDKHSRTSRSISSAVSLPGSLAFPRLIRRSRENRDRACSFLRWLFVERSRPRRSMLRPATLLGTPTLAPSTPYPASWALGCDL